jgi:hypothetical protein
MIRAVTFYSEVELNSVSYFNYVLKKMEDAVTISFIFSLFKLTQLNSTGADSDTLCPYTT